jgi:hypothetical protein
MKYSIRKNWAAAFELIVTKPIIIFPFIIIALLETMVLELAYFSTRPPISGISVPIIRKFFGEPFVHYPGILIILPKLFYYGQVVVYVLFSVFLMSITVNIIKNVKAGLPVKESAMIRNALKHYLSLMGYALIAIIIIIVTEKADMYVFSKVVRFATKHLPLVIPKLYYIVSLPLLFLANVIIQTLLMPTLPILVIEKKSLIISLAKSIYLGFRNFKTVFLLLFLPYLIYAPLMLLKSFPAELAERSIPEINLYITFAGIVVSIFVDFFIITSLTQWYIDKRS